ncbi:putative zinc-binding peptidase [Povalibacter sp.]|uniref:zinc-binding metallopeptidase family protein n=1 Tax=Povalibacter sp. TaxID=1962978 RepID=UPI002F3E501B
MKVFHCGNCNALVFFENSTCLNCGHTLAFLPDRRIVTALTQDADGAWHEPQDTRHRYRLCSNFVERQMCNWAVPMDDAHALCASCRLTTVSPDAANAEHQSNWFKLEAAKRRLVYSLLELSLPLTPRAEDPARGLAFEFKVPDPTPDAKPVLTGHANGVITINALEADDVERETRRQQLHEPYRTVLGHFRHEIGHYYWDRLIAASGRLAGFRELFGDEQQDYAAALKRHYEEGPPADWQQRFVSAYASTHPWEDWAETWAHYMHLTDTLDTAAACGLSLKPAHPEEPAMKSPPLLTHSDFARLMRDWMSLTYLLNNLNRGLGLTDAYPFVLPGPAVDKLRFVHETVSQQRS